MSEEREKEKDKWVPRKFLRPATFGEFQFKSLQDRNLDPDVLQKWNNTMLREH